jgi:hypothetical protein
MRGKLKEARSPEEQFFALALTDLRQAAELALVGVTGEDWQNCVAS